MSQVTASFTDEQKAEIRAALHAERAMQQLIDHRPGWAIAPHDNGQIQTLSSDKLNRILIPGNGWGKTTCMALDADFLMQRDDPFKPHMMPVPDRPTTAIWFCQKYQQYEMMRPEMEGIFTRGWSWKEQKKHYLWPNGSRLFLLSSDSDWTAIQGVQPDMVYFDEHPDRKFWNEMQYRRRGKSRTRYMVAATMTQGITWFVTSLIVPWEKLVKEMGLTNEQGLNQQPHKKIFMWNIGGIASNPSARPDDVEHYKEQAAVSEKELEVRLEGGYADFSGTAVFWSPSLKQMQENKIDGENGDILFTPDQDGSMEGKTFYGADGQVLGHRFGGLKDQKYFQWLPEMEVDRGRITIFEPPDPEQMDNYVMGADFAAGLEDKDYDAAIVGLKTADGQVRQVAEAHGHWGDVFFAEVLYKLGMLYYEAFLCGERQFGLPTMRRMYDEMGYVFMYFQRREEDRTRRHSDLLGHHRGAGDMIIPNHKLAIKRQDFVLVSDAAIREHKRYQYQSKVKTELIDDVTRSDRLITAAPIGENDDLVMAGAYTMHAAREIIHYVRPKRDYAPGSFGDVFKVSETLKGKKKKRDPYAMD